MLLSGRSTYLYVCPCPPVYRSPFFPVFFNAGSRRYNTEDVTYCKDVSHPSKGPSSSSTDEETKLKICALLSEDSISTRSVEKPVAASRYPSDIVSKLLLLGDELKDPPRSYTVNAISRYKTIIRSAASFLLNGGFTRTHNAAGRTERPVVSERNAAPSHLLGPPDLFLSRRDSSCPPRSPSMPSPSQITSAENESSTQGESFPAALLESSFEEFTPDVTADEHDETYRFQCSGPGLYQCRVTGLVFHMQGEGDVVYSTVPWNRRLLAQHHQPAGPLFDIKCLQRCVCQLHLPHCEIRSTGGWRFLSVAHVHDEGVEFISPQRITETHVVINITGFSAFGNVKEEDSPPVPVRALVLLFYRPPADPELTSLLNVLLLPRNVALRDVVRIRKKLVGDESYIETSPHCKLLPKQEYTLSTCPEDDSVLVQPTEAEFDCDNYDNYFPSFQVSLEKTMTHMRLFLRDTNSCHSVWERRVCLSSPGVRRFCGPSALTLPPNERLLDVRSSFINGISGPVLKSLLDRLLEKKVMNDSERESVDVIPNQRDKARSVIDSVRKKGEAASSEVIEFLCEADPFLCEHLGLF